MADRFYGYQYDTNPRKLSPENSQIRNRYSRYNDSNNDVNNQERRTSSRTKTKSIQDDEEDLYLFERRNRQKANVSKERENINKKKVEKGKRGSGCVEIGGGRIRKKTKQK